MQPDSTLKAKIVGDRGKGFKKSLDENEKMTVRCVRVRQGEMRGR